jgi:hypothetical protein
MPWRSEITAGVLALLAAIAAVAALAPSRSATAAAVASSGTTRIALVKTAPATKGLKAAGVRVTAAAPATVSASRWVLPVSGGPTVAATRLGHGGTITFRAGKRSVVLSSVVLDLSRKLTLRATVGKKKQVTLLEVSSSAAKALKRDAAKGTIRLDAAPVSLTDTGAKAIRTALKLRRLSPGRLGTLTVAVTVTRPAPPVTTTTTTTTVTTPPVPTTTTTTPDPPVPPCWADTPVGSTDWITCDEVGGADFGWGNLRSWISYILSPNWGGTLGSIPTTDGASRVSAGSPYDYRLPVATATAAGDGTVTITHTGRIEYVLPPHGVDTYVESFVITVAPGRASATVAVTAHYTPRPTTTEPSPTPVTNTRTAMTIDLTRAASTSTGPSGMTFVHAPAVLTDGGQDIWGTTYDIGAPWGAFTVTVP